MTDGIAALEGFDYQAMVALELMLDHFGTYALEARARPEGVDDLDLVWIDDGGLTQRVFAQVKKPRQTEDGTRAPSRWSLRDVVDSLIGPRWTELQSADTKVWWILGDDLDVDTRAVLGDGDPVQIWAARRAAAERLTVVLGLAPLPGAARGSPRWEGPVAASSVDDARRKWLSRFTTRAERVGFDAASTKRWVATVETVHTSLSQAVLVIEPRAPYLEADALRSRLAQRLAADYGLDPVVVRDVVFRNLRGFVDDVARSRGTWITMASLEEEILNAWPLRIPTVWPPPLPRPHLSRPRWVKELAECSGAIVGPSGSGKTTSATELFHYLRNSDLNSVILYAEIRGETSVRNWLEGVAIGVGRREKHGPLRLLPSLRAGNDDAIVRMADLLASLSYPVSLIVDFVDGAVSSEFARDLSLFVLRLPSSSQTRVWLFGQEDALAGLSTVEREVRGLHRIPSRGLGWEDFLALAELHGLRGRSELHPVYAALSASKAGVPPRIADAVMRTGSHEAALNAARSDDVLLAADTARYNSLSARAQEALGALACLSHPFRPEEAEALFPDVPARAGIAEGVRRGFLHPLGDSRSEFHETVRRNILAQQSPSFVNRCHRALADAYASREDRVLEAHHSDAAGLAERARGAGRDAFFEPKTANRIAVRAAARGWVTARETLELLKRSPNAPFGWWRALEERMDDETALALLAWWRDEVTKGEDAHHILWSAPRVLLTNRPDVLEGLLDVIVSLAAGNETSHAANAVGVALRTRDFDEAKIVDRFDRSSTEERKALAECLRTVQTPRCLARWLVHLVESNTSPPREHYRYDLSDEHVEAIVRALPDVEPAQLLLQQCWGFGSASSFLWRCRHRIGPVALALLGDDRLEPRTARVALRLLGFCAHAGLVDAARQWGKRAGEAQATALLVPLIANDRGWRVELSDLALDASLDVSTRLAAWRSFVMSGDDGQTLLSRIVDVSPELAKVCRFMAASTFAERPSLFSLELLIEHLAEPKNLQKVMGAALSRASDFADGPLAEDVAAQLIPLLKSGSADICVAVLLALTSLRQPAAMAPCLELTTAATDAAVRQLAGVAALASRSTTLAEVAGALDVLKCEEWWHAVMPARFADAASVPRLIGMARNSKLGWMVRRRALLSLKRLPGASKLDGAIEDILKERSLLGPLDTVHGLISSMVGRFLEEPSLASGLWTHGETVFVEVMAEVIASQSTFFPPSSTNIEAALRRVYAAFEHKRVSGALPSHIVRDMLNEIHILQLQGTALRTARERGMVDSLERVIASSDCPWLVVRACVERTHLEPKRPEDLAKWAKWVESGPCGSDRSLSIAVRNVLKGTLTKTKAPTSSGRETETTHRLLSAADLHALLDAEANPQPDGRIDEMDSASLASLVERLDPVDDYVVEVDGPPDQSALVHLSATGASVAEPGRRSTGRRGNRGGHRARLAARFPDRVPSQWLDSLASRSISLTQLISALADDADPARALAVLRRLFDSGVDVTSVDTFPRLGVIADEALVSWVAELSSAGGPTHVRALAEFASGVGEDAAIPLLERLLYRFDGHLASIDNVTNDIDDPWNRTLIAIVRAKRLVDVPGAGAWLVRILAKTRDWLFRGEVLEAAARFPSTWSLLEVEAVTGMDYDGVPYPTFRRADDIAHGLFSATHPREGTRLPPPSSDPS